MSRNKYYRDNSDVGSDKKKNIRRERRRSHTTKDWLEEAEELTDLSDLENNYLEEEQ